MSTTPVTLPRRIPAALGFLCGCTTLLMTGYGIIIIGIALSFVMTLLALVVLKR